MWASDGFRTSGVVQNLFYKEMFSLIASHKSGFIPDLAIPVHIIHRESNDLHAIIRNSINKRDEVWEERICVVTCMIDVSHERLKATYIC